MLLQLRSCLQLQWKHQSQYHKLAFHKLNQCSLDFLCLQHQGLLPHLPALLQQHQLPHLWGEALDTCIGCSLVVTPSDICSISPSPASAPRSPSEKSISCMICSQILFARRTHTGQVGSPVGFLWLYSHENLRCKLLRIQPRLG